MTSVDCRSEGVRTAKVRMQWKHAHVAFSPSENRYSLRIGVTLIKKSEIMWTNGGFVHFDRFGVTWLEAMAPVGMKSQIYWQERVSEWRFPFFSTQS